MIPDEELIKMKETLQSDCIDDPEEILNWFGFNGVKMIDEILENRSWYKGIKYDRNMQ